MKRLLLVLFFVLVFQCVFAGRLYSWGLAEDTSLDSVSKTVHSFDGLDFVYSENGYFDVWKDNVHQGRVSFVLDGKLGNKQLKKRARDFSWSWSVIEAGSGERCVRGFNNDSEFGWWIDLNVFEFAPLKFSHRIMNNSGLDATDVEFVYVVDVNEKTNPLAQYRRKDGSFLEFDYSSNRELSCFDTNFDEFNPSASFGLFGFLFDDFLSEGFIIEKIFFGNLASFHSALGNEKGFAVAVSKQDLSIPAGAELSIDPSLTIGHDFRDGFLLHRSDGYTARQFDSVIAGYLYYSYDYFYRAIAKFDINSIGSVESAVLNLGYKQKDVNNVTCTFDLNSIAFSDSFDVVNEDWNSEVYEKVVDDWFDETISDDISADVTTAWNNNVTAGRDFLAFRLGVDDEESFSDVNRDCLIEFYDSSDASSVINGPYIEFLADVDGNVNSPSGLSVDLNQSVAADGNYLIDFNAVSVDDNYVFAKLYYSSSQGGFENLIVDLNLLAGAESPSEDFNCSSSDFSSWANCVYDFNFASIADGYYFIDVNVYRADGASETDSGERFRSDFVRDSDNLYFDGFEYGWSNNWLGSPNDDYSWLRDQLGTPTSSTGPCSGTYCSPAGADYSDWYMYLESSNMDTNDEIWLISPEIDFDLYTDMNIEFYYNMYGSYINSLALDENTSGEWLQLWDMNGNQGTDWFSYVYDLNALSGVGNLRFRALDGAEVRGDIAIDNITISATPNQTATVPTNITCNGSSDCNVSIDSNVALNALGSTDVESDDINYYLEAYYSLTVNDPDSETGTINYFGIAPGVDVNYDDSSCGSACGSGLSYGAMGTCTDYILSEACSGASSCDGTDTVVDIQLNGTIFSQYDTIDINLVVNCYNSMDDIKIWHFNGADWNQIFFDSSCDFPGAQGTYSTTLYVDSSTENQTIRGQVSNSSLSGDDQCFTGAYGDNDDINFIVTTGTDYLDLNKAFTTYSDINASFDNIGSLSFTVLVDSYSPVASVANANSDPDLELQVWNGSAFESIGFFDLPLTYTTDEADSTDYNFTLSTTDSTILSAWATNTNQNIRVRAVYVDWNTAAIYDDIQYSAVWVSMDINNWFEIGSHGESGSIDWNTSGLSNQSCINLRARASDLNGSRTFSDYFTKGSCLSVEHAAEVEDDSNSDVVEDSSIESASTTPTPVPVSGGAFCKFKKGWNICLENESCEGRWVNAMDTDNCCIGQCIAAQSDDSKSLDSGYDANLFGESLFSGMVSAETVKAKLVSMGIPISLAEDAAVNANEFFVERFVDFEGTNKTVFSVVVSNSGSSDLNAGLIEFIPKFIAFSASEIESDYFFVILEDDPVILFDLGVIEPNQSKEIVYYVNENLGAEDWNWNGPPAVINADAIALIEAETVIATAVDSVSSDSPSENSQNNQSEKNEKSEPAKPASENNSDSLQELPVGLIVGLLALTAILLYILKNKNKQNPFTYNKHE